MKKFSRFLFLSLFCLYLWGSAPALAQNNPPLPSLDLVTLELWPDYDREALLVLITAVLPEDTPLPATLTFPLPPEADINAVAYVEATNGALLNMDYEADTNSLTFTTPSLGFRVEYYQPYQVTGTERTINFAWSLPTAVSELVTSIQQPLAAEDFTLSPPADQIQQLDTGLRYHLYTPRPFRAGQPHVINIQYDLVGNALTQQLAQSNAPHTPTDPALAPTPTTEDANGIWVPDWLLFGGGGLLLVVALFFFGSAWRERQATKTKGAVTKPKRVKASKAGSFCGTCGTAVSASAKFCPQCGTPRE